MTYMSPEQARGETSITAATSSRSASCCTRCWRDSRRSAARPASRPRARSSIEPAPRLPVTRSRRHRRSRRRHPAHRRQVPRQGSGRSLPGHEGCVVDIRAARRRLEPAPQSAAVRRSVTGAEYRRGRWLAAAASPIVARGRRFVLFTGIARRRLRPAPQRHPASRPSPCSISTTPPATRNSTGCGPASPKWW